MRFSASSLALLCSLSTTSCEQRVRVSYKPALWQAKWFRVIVLLSRLTDQGVPSALLCTSNWDRHRLCSADSCVAAALGSTFASFLAVLCLQRLTAAPLDLTGGEGASGHSEQAPGQRVCRASCPL